MPPFVFFSQTGKVRLSWGQTQGVSHNRCQRSGGHRAGHDGDAGRRILSQSRPARDPRFAPEQNPRPTYFTHRRYRIPLVRTGEELTNGPATNYCKVKFLGKNWGSFGDNYEIAIRVQFEAICSPVVARTSGERYRWLPTGWNHGGRENRTPILPIAAEDRSGIRS